MHRSAHTPSMLLVLPALLAGLLVVVPSADAQEANRSERERMILERVEDRDPEVRVDEVVESLVPERRGDGEG